MSNSRIRPHSSNPTAIVRAFNRFYTRKLGVLDQRSFDDDVAVMLDGLDQPARDRLISAMGTITEILGPPKAARPAILLRSHRSGDIGWMISRHGVIYAREYGWDMTFEALAGEIAVQFVKSFDPAREHCWIAEIDGEPVGSVVLISASRDVARLRMLLVETKARGLGIGRTLVDQCIRFAREKDYRRITLGTYSCLNAARDIYRRAGFQLIAEEPQHRFGADVVDETWELEL